MTTVDALNERSDGGSPHTGWLADFRPDPVVMRGLVWTGISLVAMTAVGFAWLMQMIPPPAPTASKQQILDWVAGNQTQILIGATLCTFFWSFWVTWASPVILYVRRMERVPLLTFAALANVGGGAAIITTIAVAWTVMAFRAEDATIVQTFLDFGFFLFLYTWPPFAILMVIIAVAIFRDVSGTSVYPRWVAYYNLYAAIAMLPASFMGLFKTGPLAYNGVLAFWLVLLDFFIWMMVMSVLTLKAITREQRQSNLAS